MTSAVGARPHTASSARVQLRPGIEQNPGSSGAVEVEEAATAALRNRTLQPETARRTMQVDAGHPTTPPQRMDIPERADAATCCFVIASAALIAWGAVALILWSAGWL